MIVVWNQYHKKQTIIRKDDKHKINQVIQGKDVRQLNYNNNNENNNSSSTNNKTTNDINKKKYNVIINGKKIVKGKNY